jgi:anti-anti-sigma factor
MTLEERLQGMELAIFPAWIFDPDASRVLWANDKAVELWRAESRAELLARAFGPVPDAAKARLDATVEQLRQGRSHWAEWTFYPKGVPTRVKLYFSPFTLDDGRIAVFQQVIPLEIEQDPVVVRSTEALMYTSIIVALVDFDGAILMSNPAAIAAFKAAGNDWLKWFAEPLEATRILRAASEGAVVKAELIARTGQGDRWHSIEIRPVRDAVSGSMVALIHHTDETSRRGAEELAEKKSLHIAELDRALSLVKRQRAQILALSAPLLDVGDRTLALPIIGALDRERSAEIAGRVLAAIRDRRARSVILDLTGADSLDSEGADLLLQLMSAIKLLGAQAIITGVQPGLALSLAASSFDAAVTPIFRTLADGIRFSSARGAA